MDDQCAWAAQSSVVSPSRLWPAAVSPTVSRCATAVPSATQSRATSGIWTTASLSIPTASTVTIVSFPPPLVHYSNCLWQDKDEHAARSVRARWFIPSLALKATAGSVWATMTKKKKEANTNGDELRTEHLPTSFPLPPPVTSPVLPPYPTSRTVRTHRPTLWYLCLEAI